MPLIELSAAPANPPAALFRPALVLMAGRFLGFLAAFAIPMVLARMFALTEFGTYKQLFLVFGTLFGIAQLGMAESLYYFLPFETTRSGRFVFNTLVLSGAAGLAVLVLLWLAQAPVAALLNNVRLAGYLPLIGLYLLLTLPAVVLEIVMTVCKQHFVASCTYALTDFLRALFLVLPVLLFADIYWLLLGAVLFALLRLGATRLYIRRELGAGLHYDAGAMRQHLGYAVPFGLAGLIEILQTNFHLYAVSWYFDAATFALYAVGCLQVPLIDFLMTSTCNVMMISMRESSLAGDHAAVVAIWLDSIRKLALVFFPLVGVLLVCAHELIVLLFTEAYAASIPVFMVWTLSMLFATLLTDGALRVFAQTRFLILQNLARLVFIVVLIRFFLDHFGLIGAIVVTLLATLLAKTLALWRLKTVMGVTLRHLLPWRALASTLGLALLSLLPALLLKSIVQVPGILLLPMTGSVYTLTYYLLLQRYGPMQPAEKRMLAQWALMPLLRARTLLRIRLLPRL